MMCDSVFIEACPFCGCDILGEIEVGMCVNPAAYWDGAMRGEISWYVSCVHCGVIMKGDSQQEVIDKWNRRADDV